MQQVVKCEILVAQYSIVQQELNRVINVMKQSRHQMSS